MERTFLTANETADYLRLSLVTIRRLTMLKKIPYTRVGRRVLYPVDEINNWLKTDCVTTEDLVEKETSVK